MAADLPALPPKNNRWYEDYQLGATYDLGTVRVIESEMISFARSFDPQPMHVDTSFPGGLIASGWYTACLAMRQIVEHYLSGNAGLPSPGIEAISWTTPVRPNDILNFTSEVISARLSASKPDRGILVTRLVARNDQGVVVMSMQATGFVRRRVETISDLNAPLDLTH